LDLRYAIVVGGVVRVIWWIIDQPVWLDEAMLALGIIHRPLGAVLIAPLPYGQITPPGFLLGQWVMVSVFGASGRVLRLAPLMASLVSLPLFARLARRVLIEDRLVIAAVWLFALDRALVMYAVEAKPYAWDVTATIAITLVVLEHRSIAASILGAILVWCSYPVMIVLAALALVWRRLSVIAIWALSAAPAIWVAEHRLSASDRDYLHQFWSDGFWRTWSWPVTQPAHVFDALLRVPPGIVWLVLVLIGVRLMKKRAVMMPALLAIAAAASGFYPLSSRLALYLLPGALLAVAAIGRWWIIVPLVAAQAIESVLPERHEDMRTVATAMARVRQPDDAVYVYYGAVPTFEFYADTTGITRGSCHRTDWPAYLGELAPLRGRKRVWLVVAHEFEGNGVREDSLLVRYLNATGRAYLTIPARSAFAVLYDLSGPANAVDVSAPRSTRELQPNLVCRAALP
jgi:hypothetical protein